MPRWRGVCNSRETERKKERGEARREWRALGRAGASVTEGPWCKAGSQQLSTRPPGEQDAG